ncbi:signal peptidase I [Candidatus Thorarchaeota archaeon]|nr:MAG: signal peptidase I [Candidatus Thorarchaeota archaeon]
MERARQALKWNQRSEITKTLFVIAIIVGVTLGGYGIFTVAMGTSNPLVVVESESMLPTLEVGHLLVLQSRAPEQIQVGDIIVFDASYHTKPIVHRIVEIQNVTGELRYFTQGDNNSLRDPMYRTYYDIIGVVVLAIPYIGHVTLFLHEPYGFAIVLILFIALLILPEIFMKDKNEEKIEELENIGEQETANP